MPEQVKDLTPEEINRIKEKDAIKTKKDKVIIK